MAQIDRLVILGAAGDLSTRLLLPAIAQAMQADRLQQPLKIVGVARAEWDSSQYQQQTADELAEYASEVDESVRNSLVSSLSYVQADATDPEALAPAFSDEPAAVYLALPPAIYSGAISALEKIGLPDGSRIVIEKPFGDELDSAIELNRQLKQAFTEESIYRIDHFTALQSVEAIPALRFANRLFETNWSRDHIQQIEIIWDNTLALEGRASYYDTAGALKDMTQNHLLQVLCMLGMERPESLHGEALRDRKVDLLKSIRKVDVEEAAQLSYRARYTAGTAKNGQVPAYVDEEGVDPDNRTETFAKIELMIDNDRWRDVPVLIRTGKAQAENRHLANIVFKPVERGPFRDESVEVPNSMQIHMLPDRLQIRTLLSHVEDPLTLRTVHFGIDLPEEAVEAHGALMINVLNGDQSRFIRDDEAEESWRVVQPFLDAWREERTPLNEYPAGTQVEPQ
jgi:glucose-6-phosphate 1-dehydrogenase